MSSDVGSAITKLLDDGNGTTAIDRLREYYAPIALPNKGFTGGQFDTFDPSGTRSNSANTFTADDLVSVTLLSVDVSSRAALELLDRQRRRFEVLLETIGPDRDVVEVDSVDEGQFPAWGLWRALRGLPGVGPTTASKLMARKRPRLIPIYDSVINKELLSGCRVQWVPVHAALRADGNALHMRLLELRARAGLDESVSALRVLDVLAWMEGKAKAVRSG